MLNKFRYDCTLCGQCCSGDMKVFLNPHDLFILGRHLKLSHTDELFERGYLVMDTGQNGIPWPRLRFQGRPIPFCPFVENHWLEDEARLKALCSLQEKAKPLVCRLAPVTRSFDINDRADKFSLTPPVEGCPGFLEEKDHLLSEYLAPLAKELERERGFFRLLSEHLDEGASPESLGAYFSFDLEAEPS